MMTCCPATCPGSRVGLGTWSEATEKTKVRCVPSTHAGWLTTVSPKPLPKRGGAVSAAAAGVSRAEAIAKPLTAAAALGRNGRRRMAMDAYFPELISVVAHRSRFTERHRSWWCSRRSADQVTTAVTCDRWRRYGPCGELRARSEGVGVAVSPFGRVLYDLRRQAKW